MENENREIDLFELLEKVFNFLKKSFRIIWISCLRFIRFHIRNIFYFLFFFAIALGLAFYFTQDKNKIFNADFIMQVNGTNSYAVADIISVLSQNIDKESNINFAKVLNVSKEDVCNVVGLESFFVIDLNNNRTRDYVDYSNSFVEDTLNSRMQNFLAIRILTKGPANHNKLQNSIIKYLRSDEYLKREELERIKVFNNAISAIDVEIQTLDRMRLAETIGTNTNLALLDKGVVRETTYYQDMIDLKARRTHLIEELTLQRNVVTIYSGVKVSTKYADKNIFVYLFAFSYLLGLLISAFVRYRKNILKAILKA